MWGYLFFTSEFRYRKWKQAKMVWGIGYFRHLEQTYSYSNAQTKSPSYRIKVSISLTPLLFVYYTIVLLMFVYSAPTHDSKILLSPPATLLSSSLCFACILNITPKNSFKCLKNWMLLKRLMVVLKKFKKIIE